MILTAIANLVGQKWAKPVLWALIALALLSMLGVAKCAYDSRVAEQAKQTERSSEAISDAAQNAVAIVTNRADADADIDNVVSAAAKEIDDAPNATIAYDAALRAACLLPAYSRDPSCQLLKVNSR